MKHTRKNRRRRYRYRCRCLYCVSGRKHGDAQRWLTANEQLETASKVESTGADDLADDIGAGDAKENE